jgi:tRNA 2-thiocytidine biosynthesis protein TtcA
MDSLLFHVVKKAGKAIWDYNMIEENDRILVAVSGGKDSLSLLFVLRERQRYVPISFEVIACFVDMGFPWVDKDGLISFLEGISVPCVVARPPSGWQRDEQLDCFWCSWNRRKALFYVAKEAQCGKIALAHHMDDIVETMLLNLFFQGEISTMRPYQEMFGGKIKIIRPFAYVEESQLSRLSERLKIPVFSAPCPNQVNSRRRLVKEIIAKIARINPNAKKNIFRSLKRVRERYLP